MPDIVIVAGSRRLRLPAGATLADLHLALSPASAELHEFAIDGQLFGEPDADDQLVGRRVTDDREVRLQPLAGKTLEYRCAGARLAVRLK